MHSQLSLKPLLWNFRSCWNQNRNQRPRRRKRTAKCRWRRKARGNHPRNALPLASSGPPPSSSKTSEWDYLRACLLPHEPVSARNNKSFLSREFPRLSKSTVRAKLQIARDAYTYIHAAGERAEEFNAARPGEREKAANLRACLWCKSLLPDMWLGFFFGVIAGTYEWWLQRVNFCYLLVDRFWWIVTYMSILWKF